MIKALRHPFGISLLLASLLLAGLGLSLDRWSGQAIWMALLVPLGLLAYAASVATVHLYWPVAPPSAAQAEISASLVHKALRNLDRPATLSRSELVALLPATLASNRARANGLGTPGELAPLEYAQALREVLIAAIEQLKPVDGATGAHGPETLQRDILYLAYVEHRPVAYITIRHNIGDTAYYRNRSSAVAVLARHLQSQEVLIGSAGAKVAGTE